MGERTTGVQWACLVNGQQCPDGDPDPRMGDSMQGADQASSMMRAARAHWLRTGHHVVVERMVQWTFPGIDQTVVAESCCDGSGTLDDGDGRRPCLRCAMDVETAPEASP